ncbi:MAG TPA: ABC transporter ATP-binding protein [Acidimicrobiia bacterium]|nr:ABC transporter ATP-binding protein [Acidimicrobiia bacterium]
MLSIRGIDKRFGALPVLTDATFDVAEGSITGLIGPNGSGKTTLFDIITGYRAPDGGSVLFAGSEIIGLKPYQLARRGLIRTFQLTRVFKGLTVLENLLVCDVSPTAEEASDRALEMLDFVRLTALADREAAALSYGQQKLLEIAQVLMLDPSMLLLDEPMAGINPGLADQIIEHLQALRAGGKTLLLIEHNLSVITTLCDKLLVLNAGSIIAEGRPEEVIKDRNVREAFLGS